MRADDFCFVELSSEVHLSFSSVDDDLSDLFQQPNGEQRLKDGYFYGRRHESIEESLKNGKINPDDLDDIIYMRVGFINGKPKKMYKGQSRFGDIRAISKTSDLIAGAKCAPFS